MPKHVFRMFNVKCLLNHFKSLKVRVCFTCLFLFYAKSNDHLLKEISGV